MSLRNGLEKNRNFQNEKLEFISDVLKSQQMDLNILLSKYLLAVQIKRQYKIQRFSSFCRSSTTVDDTFSRPKLEHTPLLNSSSPQWEHKHIQINVFIQISTNQAFSMTNVQRALKQWEATAFELNHFCITQYRHQRK